MANAGDQRDEKVLAAHRAGLKRIILPKANEKDLKDIPEEVRQDLEFILVQTIDEVLRAAFGDSAEGLPETKPTNTSTAPHTTAAVS